VAKTDFKSVDEYIATFPEATQAILQRVRGTIRKAVPGAEETISYQIPTMTLDGKLATRAGDSRWLERGVVVGIFPLRR
jgi:uncharacterized protein YdhG (YjbR/CyaY superfamily)